MDDAQPVKDVASIQSILRFFEQRDVQAATEFFREHPPVDNDSGRHDYTAHPALRAFVDSNGGHCYKPPHLRIADLLTPSAIRAFRRAVVEDRIEEVRARLTDDPNLATAEMTAGLGIAQPIHHWQSISVAKLLIAAGANLDVLTTLGESPLTMQIRFGTVDNVRFLLDQGADATTARCCAPSKSLDEIIELLLSYGWNINQGMLLHDANHGFGKRVLTWLKFGADPNVAQPDGQTALHLLASRGTAADAIRALIESGANINACDNEGNSPLDLAKLADKRAAENELNTLLGN